MRRTLAWLAAVLLGHASARAQEQVIVHEVDQRPICTMRVTAFAGSELPGGFGWLSIEVQNHDRAAHTAAVVVSTTSWSTGDVGLQRTIGLGPEEHARFFLPLPNLERASYELRTQIDGAQQRSQIDIPSGRGYTGLLVTDRPSLQPVALTLLQQAVPGVKQTVVNCSGIDLPADWRLFTGFQQVIVDGRSPLAADVQEALRRYVRAGGRVLVGSAASLPPGVLREQLERLQAPASRTEGLGRWFVVDDLERSRAAEQFRVLVDGQRELWPLPPALQSLQPVPGLGRAPVLVFLLVILCFAVVAGPVNFFLLRKWRRPLLALVTVPVLGFGTTLLMFGYGLLHDGFGVRGAMRSWTLLDQQAHAGTAIASRTLFAGLSPGSLSLGADSLLLAPAAFAPRTRRSPNRFQFSADTNRIDGAVLPSRTPTVLTTVQQGMVRDRLRVRVRPEGGLEVLADGGVQPEGAMLLRDREGTCWLGTAPILHPCSLAEAEQFVQGFGREAGQLATMAAELDYDDYRRYSKPDEVADERGLAVLRAGWLADGEPAPGTWFARVHRAPWLDDHGLDVDYDLQEHFVIGRLAAEDIVR